ncbi:unnamed protein product [Symbiodinium sp. CCMP2592]|nr:unnamed protein product [Symbiodinium sp. CCMP2592]
MRMAHDIQAAVSRVSRVDSESLLLGFLESEEVLRLPSGLAARFTRWEAELVRLQSYGHRFYLLSISWDALLQGLDQEGLKSTVDCLKRHGLEPVAALALPDELSESEAALAASHLETIRSSIRLWVTQVKLRHAGSEQELGRRRRWGSERDGIPDITATTECFFLRVQKVLQGHALLAQELFRERGGLGPGRGSDGELGIMISAEWIEAVSEASEAATAKNRQAAEWILQSQIGSILSPIFGEETPLTPDLCLCHSSEKENLKKTSFLMISHHFAGRVRVSESQTEVLHSSASPSTLAKVLSWLSWHGYVPPRQGRLGGLHAVEPAGGITNQTATPRVPHRACEKSVPLRGYWTGEVESRSPWQVREEALIANFAKAALFAQPSTEMGQHGCFSWMDPESVLVTLDFLDLCVCLDSRPDAQKLVSQISLVPCHSGHKEKARKDSSWLRDARWSSLLDQVIAKSSRQYVEKNAETQSTESTVSSISESAVDFFLQFRRQKRRAEAAEPAISRIAASTPDPTETMEATLEAVLQLCKVGEEPGPRPRFENFVASEVARVRALGEALQRQPRPPALESPASPSRATSQDEGSGLSGSRSAADGDLEHVRVQASLAASCFWWGARTKRSSLCEERA